MIEAVAVSVKRRERFLLRDVDFRLSSGEVVAILGPNGAGKSTLLRTLAGGIAPTSGEVWMGDRRLQQWSLRDRARVRAVITQDMHSAPPLSVFEMVLLGRSPHGEGGESPRARALARSAMDVTSTLQFADRSYASLSAGERQRVQMARALAQIDGPEGAGDHVLLLDEPTSNLDMFHERTLLEHARRLSRTGVAVLLVVHDMNLATAYADRVAFMHDGNIVADGPPRATLSRALLRQVFGVEVEILERSTGVSPLVLPLPPSDAMLSKSDGSEGRGN